MSAAGAGMVAWGGYLAIGAATGSPVVGFGRDLAAAMAQIRLRAERREAELFARADMRDPADFFKHWARLSALAALPITPDGPPAAIWHNPQARHPLPNDLRNALASCLASSAEA